MYFVFKAIHTRQCHCTVRFPTFRCHFPVPVFPCTQSSKLLTVRNQLFLYSTANGNGQADMAMTGGYIWTSNNMNRERWEPDNSSVTFEKRQGRRHIEDVVWPPDVAVIYQSGRL